MPLDFSSWTTWTTCYLLFEWSARCVAVFWVPTRRSPEAAKGWLLFIFFVPVVGVVVYYLIGRPDMPRWRRQRLENIIGALRPVADRLRAHPNMFQPDVGPNLNQAVVLAHKVGRLPILGGNAAELLSDYHASIARLAQDIDAARHHVHLLYYIFAADDATQPVIDALARAAARGVECRVLVDALGSRKLIAKLRLRLAPINVQLMVMLKTGLFRRFSARSDLRNHRKIAVIDGRIGYTGSQNLISATFKPGITYEEMVVRVTGPTVLALQYVFVSDWHLETETVLDSAEYFPEPELTGAAPAQVLPSGPTFAPMGNQRLVVALIHGARRRIVMTTPYFIPDAPLQSALQIAALRGVEVHLIVSEIEDQFLVGQAQRSYYEELLEVGVTIHLFQENFLHAKHLTIDDEVALIGSSNMDMRSFMLNAEISLVIYDREVTSRLKCEQQRCLERCRRLTSEEWNQRGLMPRLSQNVCRLVSPLL